MATNTPIPYGDDPNWAARAAAAAIAGNNSGVSPFGTNADVTGELQPEWAPLLSALAGATTVRGGVGQVNEAPGSISDTAGPTYDPVIDPLSSSYDPVQAAKAALIGARQSPTQRGLLNATNGASANV